MSLLSIIARCPNVSFCLDNPDAPHPCAAIVRSQPSINLREFQIPEPWNGHLNTAPILFLSSNPSISGGEEYPTWTWDDSLLEDYFVNRFGGGEKEWVRANRYNLQRDGTYSKEWVRFWAACRARAAELLDRAVEDVHPGVDYALSEVVHCKSRSEQGVGQALDECTARYLRPVVSTSGAQVVVCFGKHAGSAIRKEFGIEEGNLAGPIVIGGRDRLFLFLPHPASFETNKTVVKCLTLNEFRAVRELLSGIDPP